METKRGRGRPKVVLKKNYLDEVLEEISLENNLDIEDLKLFTHKLTHGIYCKIQRQMDFTILGWGRFEFPHLFSAERRALGIIRKTKKHRLKKIRQNKRAWKRQFKMWNRKHKRKIVKKYLRKRTSVLENILSLYK